MKKNMPLKLKITLGLVIIVMASMVGFDLFAQYIVRRHDDFSSGVISRVFDNVRKDNDTFHIERDGKELEKFAGMAETLAYIDDPSSSTSAMILKGFFISLANKCKATRFLILDKNHRVIFSEKNAEKSVSDDAVFTSEPFLKAYKQISENWAVKGFMAPSGDSIFFALISAVVNDEDETAGFAVCEIPASEVARSFSEKVKGEVAFQGVDKKISGSSNDDLFSRIKPGKKDLKRIKGDKETYRLYAMDVSTDNGAFPFRYWVAFTDTEVLSAERKLILVRILTFAGILGAVIAVLFFFLSKQLAPVHTMVGMLKDAAEGEGDLTRRLQVLSSDELGDMASLFNTFVEKLNQIMVDIGNNSETVSLSSCDLLTVSQMLAVGAEDLALKANSVAGASSELSATMDLISSSSEEASESMGQIADAASQMQSSLNQVAGHCENARSISNRATSRVERASSRVSHLGHAVREITQVTDLIDGIADQTKLLALNATIEAARAGAAGKGFAVVASEVKNLADQTSQATEGIKEKIAGIQSSSGDTISDVESIAETIADFNAIVGMIVSAVENQSVNATDVSDHIQQISMRMNDISDNVTQSSMVSSDIARDITGVHSQTDDILHRSVQVKQNAAQLSELAMKLSDMISMFKLDRSGTPPASFTPSS